MTRYRLVTEVIFKSTGVAVTPRNVELETYRRINKQEDLILTDHYPSISIFGAQK